MIDDESLVKTRTNTCLSYTSAVSSYSVLLLWLEFLSERRSKIAKTIP